MIVWLPLVRVEVENVATPPLTPVVPMGEPLSRKVTEPVGVPAPGLTTETVAVKVTVWPGVDGLGVRRLRREHQPRLSAERTG